MKINLVHPEKLILGTAAELENVPEVTPPTWAAFAKTGAHNERPPTQDNWWYIRAAAILRKVAKMGPIGTNKLKVQYGGRKNRGVKPDRFQTGSGNIIRTALQQLEAAGLVKQDERSGHKGRVITAKGQSLLDKTVNKVAQ